MTAAGTPQPSARHGRCQCCGTPLTFSQKVRGAVCDQRKCQHHATHARLNEAYRDLQQRRQVAARRIAQEVYGPRQREDDPPLRPLPIPANVRQLAPLPAERRAAFVAHLEALVHLALPTQRPATEDAQEELGAPDEPFVSDDSEEMGAVASAAEPGAADNEHGTDVHRTMDGLALQVIGQTCGTCRGHCCALGAPNNAFLTTETIQRFARHQPQPTADAILAQYVARMPLASYEESCVYHTETGCCLTREMRSSTCNNFLCNDLESVLRAADVLALNATVLVALDETELVRTHRVQLEQVSD